MLDWLLKLIGQPQDAPPPRCAIPCVRVAHDERIISVRDQKGRVALIHWSDLIRVHVLVSKADSDPDFSWVLSDRDGRGTLAVPMGADGEHDLVKTMQARLAGFDNMAVVEALSSPSSGEFQIWPPVDLV